MSKEALKLALEALETELSIDWTNNDEFNASAEKMYEAITALRKALAAQPAQQEPVAWMDIDEKGAASGLRYWSEPDNRHEVALYTTSHRRPLTHEQRVDLLTKFEAHKHEWHAPAILIDMVEAAHNIKE